MLIPPAFHTRFKHIASTLISYQLQQLIIIIGNSELLKKQIATKIKCKSVFVLFHGNISKYNRIASVAAAKHPLIPVLLHEFMHHNSCDIEPLFPVPHSRIAEVPRVRQRLKSCLIPRWYSRCTLVVLNLNLRYSRSQDSTGNRQSTSSGADGKVLVRRAGTGTQSDASPTKSTCKNWAPSKK